MTDETQRSRADGPADPGDALLGQLRRVAALIDPVPESLVHAARETLTWLRVDAELAELLSDSAFEEARSALVRGHGEPRAVSFDAGGLTIELDVLTDGMHRKLVGQLVPAEVATIEVQSAEQRQTVTADSHGRFHAEGISAGRMRLRITGHSLSDRPIETSWITI
jgi:hypothetical protein